VTRVEFISVKKIRPSSLNPREEFGEESLDRLAQGILKHGLLQPIVVRPSGDGFEVVVGERRFRAAKKAGLLEIPAVIQAYEDRDVIEVSLVENLHREELSAVEKGRACLNLVAKYPEMFPSASAIAERLGYSASVVRDWMQLAEDTPRELQKLIGPETYRGRVPQGKIDYRTAITIARKVKDSEKKVQLAKAIAQDRLRGPRAREVVSRLARSPSKSVERVIEEFEKEPAFLPFSYKHAQDILTRKKSQTSRRSLDPKIREGARVKAAISHFADLIVTKVERRKLGDFTEEDAQREGGYTLAEFRDVWRKLHGRWKPGESVYVIHFSVAKEATELI